MRFLLVLAAAGIFAASAAADVRIAGVDTSGYPHVSVSVVAPLGSSRPTLSEDGTPVTPDESVSFAAAKRVVLAVDRSHSMAGASLANALAAARIFVASGSSKDDIRFVAFGHAAASEQSIDGLRVDTTTGTALWDAVALGARELSTAPAGEGRVIVVVTDGRDVSSTSSFAQAVAAAHRVHAAVYTVGISSSDFAPGPLRLLASQTGGAYVEASSSAQLTGLYRSISSSLARTWQLRYVSTAAPGTRIKLAASANGQTSAVAAVSLGAVDSAPNAPAVLPRSVWRSPLAPAVLALLVGLLVLFAVLFVNAARRPNWLTARLAPHVETRRKKAEPKRSVAMTLPKRLFAATERMFADVRQFRTLQKLLARADLPLKAGELVYICLGGGIVLLAIAAAAKAPAFTILLFAVIGGGSPIVFVALKARSRLNAFDEQLPDLLTTIAASLKAGHSFRHAIQSVVDEGADPAAKEFRRLLAETRLGRPMDVALAELSERIGSKNLAFALNAVMIQRQIGGSLAGLFDMVAETVRARQQFARKIRALTAMGRMSAYVLVALPFGVALVVTVLNHSYMSVLWSSPTGHKLVFAGLVMIAIGSGFLRKIVSFRG